MKFSIKNFFSKCDQIRRKPRIWSHLLKKSLMENFIFCVVLPYWNLRFAVQGECKISNFLHFRTQFHSSNTLALFINFIMVTSLLSKHHFKLKMCEHLGISALTGKVMMILPLKKHILFSNHSPDIEEFSILYHQQRI